MLTAEMNVFIASLFICKHSSFKKWVSAVGFPVELLAIYLAV